MIDESVAKLTAQFKTKEELQEALNQRGITEAVMREEVKKQLAAEELLKQFDSKQNITVTDEEALAYYKEKPDYFQRPEAVKLSSISIKAAPDASPEEIAAAKVKVEAALKELKEGKKFADVVKAYSEDSYKDKDGLMGYVTQKDNLAKSLLDAAFSLNTGETSGIVKTVFGFHILFANEKKAAMQFSFEDVKDRIRENLHDNKLMNKRIEYQKELSEKSAIEIFVNTGK
jgi:parvulin-like peptidyl-prolyl isomerase